MNDLLDSTTISRKYPFKMNFGQINFSWRTYWFWINEILLGEFICPYSDFTEQDVNDLKILPNAEAS